MSDGGSPNGVSDSGRSAALTAVLAAIDGAVRQLDASAARDEVLAELIPRHRRLLVTREESLRPVGRVWRLGVFLLDREGVLRATGSITRATNPGRPAYQSRSAEARRAERAAAQRGHIRDGETVNWDTRVIPLDPDALADAAGPLVLRDDGAFVRWSAAADATIPFDRYLAERVELLVHPPEGA